MIHPVLTIVFDLFLIGSTLTIIAGIAAETRLARRHAVGSSRSRVHHRAAPSVQRRAAAPRRAFSGRRGVLVRG